jgi:hypothetical protein
VVCFDQHAGSGAGWLWCMELQAPATILGMETLCSSKLHLKICLYWHFVDIIWIFLRAGVYLWGCSLPIVNIYFFLLEVLKKHIIIL